MLKIRFREEDGTDVHPLQALCPWLNHVTPGLVLNKDGSLLAAFQYRGVDPDDLFDAQVDSYTEQMQKVFSRLDSRVTAWWIVDKRRDTNYIEGTFENQTAADLDDIYSQRFKRGQHFKTSYTLYLNRLLAQTAPAKPGSTSPVRRDGRECRPWSACQTAIAGPSRSNTALRRCRHPVPPQSAGADCCSWPGRRIGAVDIDAGVEVCIHPAEVLYVFDIEAQRIDAAVPLRTPAGHGRADADLVVGNLAVVIAAREQRDGSAAVGQSFASKRDGGARRQIAAVGNAVEVLADAGTGAVIVLEHAARHDVSRSVCTSVARMSAPLASAKSTRNVNESLSP